MPRLDSSVRSLLKRLEHEAALWREEPIRRVALRNKLLRPLRQRQFHSFGPDSFVDRPVWLYGTHKISIGAGVIVLRGGWLAVDKVAWHSPSTALRLGDRVGVRVGCTLSAAESVILEDDVGLAAYVTVIDSKHTWRAGNPNPLYGDVEAAPVRIGRGTWVADRATVAAGSEIGEQCAIGPNTVVSGKSIPDFSIVLGNPGRVVGSTRV